MTVENCMYPDVANSTIPCPFKATEVMPGYHIDQVHKHKKETKGEEPEAKKIKRMEPKPPKFRESEKRDELKRKQAEFKAYTNRTKISGEDETDNLYLTCESPLRKKLVASSKIQPIIRLTKPDILMSEIERIPKHSLVIENQQFRTLKQEEDESINNFEAQVRSKASHCKFNTYKCAR